MSGQKPTMTNVEFAVENRELNEAYATLLGQALKYMSQWQYDKLVKDRVWHTRLLEHHYYDR